MSDLSIFADESGGQNGRSRYCLVTLVFHNQSDPINAAIVEYAADLARRGLDDVVSHAGPLMYGTGDYATYDMGTRKMMLSVFEGFVRRLPFRYHTFAYKRSEVSDPAEFTRRFKRDLVILLMDELAYFQDFNVVKIYYDGGQPMVTKALHKAIDFAISKQAVEYRAASPRDYRFFQVADYLCTLELADIKFHAKELTKTDIKVFGADYQAFKRNHLKKIRGKLI